MNRNVESHFALAPNLLDVKRSIFDKSHGFKFSANVGELVPFMVEEVLPGDSFKVTTSKVVRLQTLLHPILDNMYMDIYYFYVRNRTIWDHWVNFCGESEDAWLPETEYTIPKLSITHHPGVGSLADYMGIAPNVETGTTLTTPAVNALPFRAYAKICDDWFRDQNLTDPLVIYTGDSTQAMNGKTDDDIYCALGGPVFHVAKYHDYFTSCTPAPQSGPDVLIPTSNSDGFAKVGTTGILHDGFLNSGNNELRMKSGTGNDFSIISGKPTEDSDGSYYKVGAGAGYRPVNLYADVGATLGTINDLRIAFQVQKYYEKLLFGRRYTEQLRSMFGVVAPDANLQRSEYLGGNRIPLNISEVAQNSPGENSFVGDLGAMSRTVDVSQDFTHSFTEHGWLIGVCCVRYDHTYGQGIQRFWSRDTIFDYYNPVFANIGNQAVYDKEIYWSNTDDSQGSHYFNVFGYQEAWADYRFSQSRYAAEMRPDVSNTLASWHLGDDYDTWPTLSDSWIREDKTNVDRTLAVTSSVSNQYFGDFYINCRATRVMPMYSIPGLADHH